MASVIQNRYSYSTITFDLIINGFSKMSSEEGLYSDAFSVGGFQWKLQIYYPKGYDQVLQYLSVYLIPCRVDSSKFPVAEFSVSVLNQIDYSESPKQGFGHKFNKESISGRGLPAVMPLSELCDPGKGYIVHDTCVLRVEVSCGTMDDDVNEDMNGSKPEKAMQSKVYNSGTGGQPFGEGQDKSKVGFGEDKQEFEDIGGFHVLKTQALLYTKIWLNYGHIPSTRVMPISSYPVLVMVVKDLMSSIMDMYECHYVDLSSEMIDRWEHMITMAEKFEFNIGWLRKRFEHVKKCMGGMQNVKNELLKHGQRLRETKSKMRFLKDLMTNVGVEMLAEMDDVRAKISGLLSKSDMETYLKVGDDLLLDGLLDGVYENKSMSLVLMERT